MCGISLVVSQKESNCKGELPGCSSTLSDALKMKLSALLTSRGPDAQNAVSAAFPADMAAIVDSGNFEIDVPSAMIDLWMFGSVLHIQGESVTAQPCVDHKGNILLWNGEVFGQNDDSEIVEGKLEIKEGESDTTAVARMLAFAADSIAKSGTALTSHSDHCRAITTAITHCLSMIHGPYAFVYYHKATNSIHFGRDPFGRRSLVVGHAVPLIDAVCSEMSTGVDIVIDPNNPLVLSSVCPPKATASEIICDGKVLHANSAGNSDIQWEEVNISGVYCLHFKSSQTSSATSATNVLNLSCVPWPVHRLRVGRGLNCTQNKTHSVVGKDSDSGVLFCNTLQGAVQRRGNSMPNTHTSASTITHSETNSIEHSMVSMDGRSRVGVLFSGGIDSVLLTALLHHSTPPELSIDLLNVTFIKTTGTNNSNGSTPSPDRVAAIAALLELKVCIILFYL